MTKRKHKSLYIFLLLVLLIQGCAQVKLDNAQTALPVAQKTAARTPTKIFSTPTAAQIIATATRIIIPSMTPAPKVTLSAVKGNLNIRRGPDIAYNPIGVLYKDTTVNVVARDVLTKWAQIIMPDSTQTGWVSLLTQYSKVEGNLDALPEFKIIDWPIAGYVRNCTHHGIFLTPGNIYIDSAFKSPENLVWVYPGHYKVYDIDMPDPVQLDSIDTREGVTVDIREDGDGDRHKCP